MYYMCVVVISLSDCIWGLSCVRYGMWCIDMFVVVYCWVGDCGQCFGVFYDFVKEIVFLGGQFDFVDLIISIFCKGVGCVIQILYRNVCVIVIIGQIFDWFGYKGCVEFVFFCDGFDYEFKE